MVSARAEALVLNGPESFERRWLDIPVTADDAGLLRVEACGLCGTDHEQYSGHIRSRFPFVPGHEIVGVIEEIGGEAARRWGVAVGDRVAVEVFKSCRDCDQCRSGLYRRCVRNGPRTMFGFVDVDHEHGLWGGYSTHLVLDRDAMLLPVPEGLDPVLATAFNPIGAGIRWGATLPQTGPDAVVAVLGPGIRGLAAAAAAKEAGAAFVAMTGLGPRDLPRLAVAERFGVDLVIDVSVDDPAKRLRQELGVLADVVVDVTAKAPMAFAQAVSLAAIGGTVVVAGTRGIAETPGFDPDHVVYKELRILGALGVDLPAYEAALALLVSGRYPFDELHRVSVGMNDLEPLLQVLAGLSSSDADPPVHSVFVPDL